MSAAASTTSKQRTQTPVAATRKTLKPKSKPRLKSKQTPKSKPQQLSDAEADESSGETSASEPEVETAQLKSDQPNDGSLECAATDYVSLVPKVNAREVAAEVVADLKKLKAAELRAKALKHRLAVKRNVLSTSTFVFDQPFL